MSIPAPISPVMSNMRALRRLLQAGAALYCNGAPSPRCLESMKEQSEFMGMVHAFCEKIKPGDVLPSLTRQACQIASEGADYRRRVSGHKALYLDLDETALNAQKEIGADTRLALEHYKRCGGRFGFATGRSLLQTQKFLETLRPNLPAVLFNGGMIVSAENNKMLNVTPLSEEVLRAAITIIRSVPKGVKAVVVQTAKEQIADRSNNDVQGHYTKSNFTSLRVDNTLTHTSDDPAIKIEIVVVESEIAAVRDAVASRLDGTANVVATDTTVEVVPLGIDKAAGIRLALSGTGLVLERDVITFGNSGNDNTMLLGAAYGIVVQNCHPETCAAADAKIGPNNSGAISEFIEKVLIPPVCQ